MGTSLSGFFAALYDFSFHSFVTPKIVRIVYVIALVIIALWSLSFLISGFIVSRTFLGDYQPSAGTMLFHKAVSQVTALPASKTREVKVPELA